MKVIIIIIIIIIMNTTAQDTSDGHTFVEKQTNCQEKPIKILLLFTSPVLLSAEYPWQKGNIGDPSSSTPQMSQRLLVKLLILVLIQQSTLHKLFYCFWRLALSNLSS